MPGGRVQKRLEVIQISRRGGIEPLQETRNLVKRPDECSNERFDGRLRVGEIGTKDPQGHFKSKTGYIRGVDPIER